MVMELTGELGRFTHPRRPKPLNEVLQDFPSLAITSAIIALGGIWFFSILDKLKDKKIVEDKEKSEEDNEEDVTSHWRGK